MSVLASDRVWQGVKFKPPVTGSGGIPGYLSFIWRHEVWGKHGVCWFQAVETYSGTIMWFSNTIPTVVAVVYTLKWEFLSSRSRNTCEFIVSSLHTIWHKTRHSQEARWIRPNKKYRHQRKIPGWRDVFHWPWSRPERPCWQIPMDLWLQDVSWTRPVPCVLQLYSVCSLKSQVSYLKSDTIINMSIWGFKL